MQRKRGELVPIGEALVDLPGQVQTLQPSTPTQHHFTVADQVNRLVTASEVKPDLGFMARTMALCSLPRRDLGNQKEYVRENGPFTLGMTAGVKNKLPFGNLPRLLLSWLCSEIVRTGSRELVLGKSLADFMRKLGVYSTSGEKYTRLREQMDRLFSSTIQLVYKDARGKAIVNSPIADSALFWWMQDPGSAETSPTKIRVSESFFNEIMSHPVPLEMNTLKALKRSTLGLDLYLWLTYRVFALRAPQRLTWKQLYRQFGAHPERASDNNTVQAFRYKILRELKKIKLAWSGHCQSKVAGLSYSAWDRGLGRPKLTPLGECSGAVELEMVP